MKSVISLRKRFFVNGFQHDTIETISAEDIRAGIAPNNTGGTGYRPRYVETVIYYLMEYYPNSCDEVDAGAWTVLNKPQFGIATPGTLDMTIPGCGDKLFHYAALNYIWQSHTNKTVSPNPYGPGDLISARWKSVSFNITFDLTIYVPVVRPKGETSHFDGFVGPFESRGSWTQTLQPPDDDAGFDFSGEYVREVFLRQYEQCVAKPVAGGSSGALPSAGGIEPGKPSLPWLVRAGNVWGPDQVGRDPCTVEYFRCNKATPCGYFVRQQMSISSPADGGAQGTFTPYTENNLSAALNGFIVPLSQNKLGLGTISSSRNLEVNVKHLVTSSFSCAAVSPPPDLSSCGKD